MQGQEFAWSPFRILASMSLRLSMQLKACFAGEIVFWCGFVDVTVDGPHKNPGASTPILEPLCTSSGSTETTSFSAIFARDFISCGMTEHVCYYIMLYIYMCVTCMSHVSHSQEVLLVLGGLQQLFNLLFATWLVKWRSLECWLDIAWYPTSSHWLPNIAPASCQGSDLTSAAWSWPWSGAGVSLRASVWLGSGFHWQILKGRRSSTSKK